MAYSYRGPFQLTASYGYSEQLSNSYGESIQRHRLGVTAGFRLPWELTLLAAGTLQFTRFPDGVYLTEELQIAEDDGELQLRHAEVGAAHHAEASTSTCATRCTSTCCPAALGSFTHVTSSRWGSRSTSEAPKARAALRLIYSRKALTPDATNRFGELLIELGLVTQSQVHEALALKPLTGNRLGEALLSLGHLTRTQLQRALSLAFAAG